MKLKPCPFCGDTQRPERVVDSLGTRRIECWNCGAFSPSLVPNEDCLETTNRRLAERAWNSRTEPGP